MDTLAKRYAKDIHDNLRLYAAWPPNAPIELGAYGPITDGIFQRMGTISQDFGIDVATIANPTKTHWDYQSQGVSLERADLSAGANFPAPGVPIGAKGRLTITFMNANSVFFTAADCIYESIDHLKDVKDEIMTLYKSSKLNSDYVVVTNLIRAGATTTIVSVNRGGSIALDADVEGTKLNLANTQIGLTVSKEANIGFRIIAEAGLAPLFGLSGLQQRNFFESLFEPETQITTLQALQEDTATSLSGAELVQRYSALSPQTALKSNIALDDVFAFRKLS